VRLVKSQGFERRYQTHMRKTVEPRMGEEDWREVLVFGTVGFGLELLQDQSFGAAVGQVVTGVELSA
jgi:hypothetical protein